VDALLARYGGVEYALRTAAEYSRRAEVAVARLPATPARASLQALTEFVVVRSR
jgi:geranylgeranyl pyrophosphate synthase